MGAVPCACVETGLSVESPQLVQVTDIADVTEHSFEFTKEGEVVAVDAEEAREARAGEAAEKAGAPEAIIACKAPEVEEAPKPEARREPGKEKDKYRSLVVVSLWDTECRPSRPSTYTSEDGGDLSPLPARHLDLVSDGDEATTLSPPSTRSVRSMRSTSTMDTDTTRKSVQISDAISVHSFKMQAEEKKETVITRANGPKGQGIKRSSTYATLGLGYLVDHKEHERRLSGERLRISDLETVVEVTSTLPRPLCFADHVELRGEIAHGSFAVVYKAATKGSQRARLAVKRVARRGLVAYENFRIFHAETKFRGGVQHPNLSWPQMVFQEPDYLYLIMELLTGPTLFDKISARGAITSKALATKYLFEMLSGLAHLHGHGIMHRDVKPENYMFASLGERAPLKLLDFAVSRSFEEGEVVKTRVGTLAYAAPELLEGSYNEKCDVWSCACTLFVCCAGAHPFIGSNDQATIWKIRGGFIVWQPVEWLPEKLLCSLQDMLQKDHSRRPTAIQLAADEWLRSGASAAARGCIGPSDLSAGAALRALGSAMWALPLPSGPPSRLRPSQPKA